MSLTRQFVLAHDTSISFAESTFHFCEQVITPGEMPGTISLKLDIELGIVSIAAPRRGLTVR